MKGRADVFREWFAITPSAARIAAALYEADGAMVEHQAVRAAGRQTQNGVELSIKQLRAAMERDAILTTYGRGYSLTVIGVIDCDAGLADAAARDQAA